MSNRRVTVQLIRYKLIEGQSPVSTVNRLLQQNHGDCTEVLLHLRDPQTDAELEITLFKAELIHDPADGALFFTGSVRPGSFATGHVYLKADDEGVIGSIAIRF